MNNAKNERLRNIIAKKIAEIIQTELGDLEFNLVVVNDVELSNDKAFAKIYVSNLNRQFSNKKMIEKLNRAKGVIRKSLSRFLKTYKCPQLTFMLDDSFNQGQKIERLIGDIHEK